jgi:copper resistance protein C
MSFRRLVTTVLLAAVTVVLTAVPAAAHAELIASTPAEGASVPTAPTQVRLTFSEPVTLAPNVLEITGPANARWTVGTPAVAGADVTVPVRASGPAGAYTMVYRVVSADGDAVSGSVRFTMTAAVPARTATSTAAATASPPAPESAESTAAAPATADTENPAESAAGDGSGPSAWVWILAAAALVAAGVVIALRVSRSGSGTRQPPTGEN